MTIPEAAEHFKVSTATIRRWIRSGRVSSQLTLGPFGEQWMVDPDGLKQESREISGYVPVEQLVAPGQGPVTPSLSLTATGVPLAGAPVASGTGSAQTPASLCNPAQLSAGPDRQRESPEQISGEDLIREAEQALQEAWRAREKAERELAELRQNPPDATALRADLEGSERLIGSLRQQLDQFRVSQDEAWQETRTALKALQQAYQQNEELGRRLQVLERESECFRRSLAQRLGLDWREFDTLQLFLRWESQFSDFNSSGSMERVNWSNFRRQAVTEDLQNSAG